MLIINPLFRTDSYKPSHYLQYPPDMKGYFGYVEARQSIKSIEPYPETIFVGLQMFLKEYMTTPITHDDVSEAAEFYPEHGEPFDEQGFRRVVDKYDGYFPLIIKAVPEGCCIPEGNVLATVECTDPKLFWLASFIETKLLRSIWYPSTVATNSRECKKVILKYLNLTSDDPQKDLLFKLHDFGARGVSSGESSGLGGVGHLVNFMGSDNVESIQHAKHYYGIRMAGYSIPASEHSTITTWGKDHEVDAYRNMIRQFGKPGKVFACVSDSYDVFNACEKIWGTELRDEVINSGATVVIRPDSGFPPHTVLKCLKILDEKFGSIINNKGYKVLNNVRIIQGDGINLQTIKDICSWVTNAGYSLDNVNFGMGGALLQHLNRDTLRFAMKCSAKLIETENGSEWVDAYKEPVTDPGKASKRGRLSLYSYRCGHGTSMKYITMPMLNDSNKADKTGLPISLPLGLELTEVLQPVYVNGQLLNESNFEEVRQRASL